MKKRIEKLLETEFSLNTTVLFLFSIITIVLLSIVGTQLFYIDKKLSLNSIDSKINSIAYNIQTSIKSSEKIHFTTIELLTSINQKDNFKLYINTLKNLNSAYAVYTGYEDGSFYEIINLDIDENLRNKYKATPKDKWLHIKIDGKNITKREVSLYDEELNLNTSRIEENNYNPTQRPWYKLAIENQDSIKTPPYKFSHIDTSGLTYAKKLNNSKDIIAIDVLIGDFKNLYKNEINKDSMEIFLFQKDYTVISTLSENNNLFNKFLEQNKDLKEFENTNIIKLNNKRYITQVVLIDNHNKNEYLVLFADFEKTIKQYNQQTFKLILIFILTSLLMIPVILYFSKIIVKPIYRLVKQSIRIKNREYQSIGKIKSSIKEVSLLSTAFEDMSKSIYQYQYYLEEKVKQRTQELSLKNEELYKLSITDKLTNLFNREKIDSTLQEEINRSQRYGTVFSIILIDIDFFKKVNDNFGHQVGDEVLQECAKVFASTLRQTDILGRWGGEEFLIICPQTTQENAIKTAEKLNTVIKLHKFVTYPNSITISVGVASYNKDIKKFDDIVLNADKALYEAKNQGRDRVVVSL